MIYFDGTHLLSDQSLEELHRFAQNIGVRREWFQDKSIPHYDLWGRMAKKAVESGAIEIEPSLTYLEILKKIKEWG